MRRRSAPQGSVKCGGLLCPFTRTWTVMINFPHELVNGQRALVDMRTINASPVDGRIERLGLFVELMNHPQKVAIYIGDIRKDFLSKERTREKVYVGGIVMRENIREEVLQIYGRYRFFCTKSTVHFFISRCLNSVSTDTNDFAVIADGRSSHLVNSKKHPHKRLGYSLYVRKYAQGPTGAVSRLFVRRSKQYKKYCDVHDQKFCQVRQL